MEQTQGISRNKVAGALLWKFLERIGVNGAQFLLQVVLARLLSPDHYGVLSMMAIFTTLAGVFVQQGFSVALVQNKDVTEEDYSTVLWLSLAVALGMYGILFFAAPLIGQFYNVPKIKYYLRVLALMLFPGALNSVQTAKLKREINFKKIFISHFVGIVFSGVVSIVIAYMGGGVWALVAHSILNLLINCIVVQFVVHFRVRFVCNLARAKTLFRFGWKLLASSLIETIYGDIQGLVVGKKYSAGDLGFYSRGTQFPQFITSTVNTTVQSVLLPVMSKKQNEPEVLKSMMRKSVILSSYLIFPMMAGLAAIAPQLVSFLLGDKWLPCVPFLRICCFTFGFYPVHTCNLQAINAIGRSDIYLKLEIIKKIYGIIALAISLIFFNSPLAIAMTGIFTTVISCFVNASPNKKLINYSYFEQMKDILPSFAISLAMLGVVLVVGQLNINNLLLLAIQIIVGIFAYLILSMITGLEPCKILLEEIRPFSKKIKLRK